MQSNRYSIILYQTRIAIEFLQQDSTEKIEIHTLSIITGYSEEVILESLELGNLSATNINSKVAFSKN